MKKLIYLSKTEFDNLPKYIKDKYIWEIIIGYQGKLIAIGRLKGVSQNCEPMQQTT
jgi:hypothetical protein